MTEIVLSLPDPKFKLGDYVLFSHNVLTFGAIVAVTADVYLLSSKSEPDMKQITSGWNYKVIYKNRHGSVDNQTVPEKVMHSADRIRQEIVDSGHEITAFHYAVDVAMLRKLEENWYAVDYQNYIDYSSYPPYRMVLR